MVLRSIKQLAPRNTALPADEAPRLSAAVEENLRDIQGQVAVLPTFSIRTFRYLSQQTQGRMSLRTDLLRPPRAVLLTRAVEVDSADSTTFLETPTSWSWEGGSVSFLEPPSMLPSTNYELTFIIIGDN